jgi:diguanylate cyclase (GGDEF)-like protein/PAS domain S-box-containing protein
MEKKNILLIDDDLNIRKTLSDILEIKGYKSSSVGTGREGLDFIRKFSPKLAIIDLGLPDMSGLEVLSRINTDNPSTEAIILTGNASLDTAIEATNKGAFSYLLKPYDIDQLILHIKRAIEKQENRATIIRHSSELQKINAELMRTNAELTKTKISECDAREYAESIINTVREPLIALDKDLRIVTASRSFYEIFMVKPEETEGRLIYDLGNKQWDIPKLRELLENILPQKTTFENYEVEHEFSTIGRRVMLLNARQIQRGEGKERILLLAIEDITERKQSEEKIQQMAFHDSLTGLPNRKLFSDRLDIALAQRNQNNVGVAMIDLDNFKDVNDTLGHDVGDRLLKATAERLKATLRKGDTVARIGGDEFALVLPDLEVIEGAIQVAQKIVDSFCKPFLIDTHQLVVTASIGIAASPHDGTDEGMLLKNADIAMYQAKQAGRAQYQLYKVRY